MCQNCTLKKAKLIKGDEATAADFQGVASLMLIAPACWLSVRVPLYPCLCVTSCLPVTSVSHVTSWYTPSCLVCPPVLPSLYIVSPPRTCLFQGLCPTPVVRNCVFCTMGVQESKGLHSKETEEIAKVEKAVFNRALPPLLPLPCPPQATELGHHYLLIDARSGADPAVPLPDHRLPHISLINTRPPAMASLAATLTSNNDASDWESEEEYEAGPAEEAVWSPQEVALQATADDEDDRTGEAAGSRREWDAASDKIAGALSGTQQVGPRAVSCLLLPLSLSVSGSRLRDLISAPAAAKSCHAPATGAKSAGAAAQGRA